MCPKAYRWVGEMEEIAKTFNDNDLSEKLFHGVAETYSIVEKREKGQTAEEVTDILTRFVSKN